MEQRSHIHECIDDRSCYDWNYDSSADSQKEPVEIDKMLCVLRMAECAVFAFIFVESMENHRN